MPIKKKFNLVIFLLVFPFHGALAEGVQCFYKHEFIETIEGSEHLPRQVCFSHISTISDRILKIEGEPIFGEFPLEKIVETDEVIKYMTYVFSKDHFKGEKLWGRVTLRISADILKSDRAIDYIYLAAEFFVLRSDGEFDTHIYYYKRHK